MITASIRFHFCAAHRLSKHEGKCREVHGHNYVAVVTVRRAQESPFDDPLDPVGRVIDFSELKATVGGWINTNWDHKLIINRDDSDDVFRRYFRGLELIEYGERMNCYLMNGDPTAERMALHLFEQLSVLLPKNVSPVSVQIWETENCYAEARQVERGEKEWEPEIERSIQNGTPR